MTIMRKTTVRYSDCFKLSIVEEIEKNGLSIENCRRKYGIGGSTTIQKWLKKYGKNHLLNKIVRVETIDEIQQLKALKKELRALKEAYAEISLENKVFKTYLEIYGEETGKSDEIKKKLEQELSKYFPKQKR